MSLIVSPDQVDAWAKRVQALDDEVQYTEMLGALTAEPGPALELLGALGQFGDPVVRAWAGSTASRLFRRDAIPLLARLVKDRDPDVRDSAREDWIAIDPDYERTLLPASRSILRRRRDKWGEDQAAMFRVARLRDVEAVPILREYASLHDSGHWHNRMPLVLADYIEDPASLGRRIRAHDHDFMLWLADAAMILNDSEGQAALAALVHQRVDEACAGIATERVRRAR